MVRLYLMLFIMLLMLAVPVKSIAATPAKDNQLQQLKEKTEVLANRIEALEKTNHDLKTKLSFASNINEAKWDLAKLFINLIIGLVILLLISGGAAYFTVKNYLRDQLARDIRERGQTIEKNVEDQLTAHKKEADEDLSIHTNELDSRIWGTQGLILSRLLEAYEEKPEQWRVYWNAAEDHTRLSLGEAEKLPESDPKWEQRVCIIKNNLAFLLILDGMPNKREEAIKLSEYVYEKAPKYSDGYHFEDTYGWALLVFAQNEQEKTKAAELLNTVYSRPTLPQGWVQDRKAKLEKFLRKEN